MKRILTIAMALQSMAALAQCPDITLSDEGVYPSSLGQACLNAFYAQELTLVYPVDTTMNVVPIGPVTIPIDSVTLDAVNNLPIGMSYVCADPSCTSAPTIAGQPARECVTIIGTPSNIPSSDTLEFVVTAWVTILGNPLNISTTFRRVVFPLGMNTSSSITQEACSLYNSPSGNHTWTASGNYLDTKPFAGGRATTGPSDMATGNGYRMDSAVTKYSMTLPQIKKSGKTYWPLTPIRLLN